jgi:hypothetical protein
MQNLTENYSVDKLQFGSLYVTTVNVFFVTVIWSKTVIRLTNHYLHVKQFKSSALIHNQKLIFISHINMANIFVKCCKHILGGSKYNKHNFEESTDCFMALKQLQSWWFSKKLKPQKHAFHLNISCLHFTSNKLTLE